MRKIKIQEWEEDATRPKLDNGGKPILDGKGEQVLEVYKAKVDTVAALRLLIRIAPADKLPRGYDAFRAFHKIEKAFAKALADPGKVLEMEDADYEFLRRIAQDNVPMEWGKGGPLSDTIAEFMEAKAE